MKKHLITLSMLAGLLTSTAHAVLILSDDFDSYNIGNLVGQGTWFAHSAGGSQPVQVVTNAQSANNKQIKVANPAGSAEDVSVPLAGAPYATNSGVKLYSRYSLIVSNATDLPTLLTGGYISHFKDAANGVSFHARVFISTSN